ncbi:MAG: Aurachin B dehydrogenase [Bacteroidia bacterium]|nr:Aurachin B dehydrogenase [Bacteroidia bacterium]
MIAVTGSAGHIGNTLIRQLIKSGHKVKAMISPNGFDLPIKGIATETVVADVCDINSLRKAFEGIHTVYHLAGYISITRKEGAILEKVNVEGTRNVVQACLDAGVKRLVYTSTIHALVEPPSGEFITEILEHPEKVVAGTYSHSKIRATKEVIRAADRGLDVVVVFPGGVFGPFDFYPSNIGKMINLFIQGRSRFYIKGGYNFVDVRDVAAGLILAAEKGKTAEGYLLTGEHITLDRFFETMKSVSGLNYTTISLPYWMAMPGSYMVEYYSLRTNSKPYFTPYSLRVLRSNGHVDLQKSSAALNYKPRSFEQSIKDTIEWFKGNTVSEL